MKYIDEFRESSLIDRIISRIKDYDKQEITLMEVCGTHTRAAFNFGLKELLPTGVSLTAGPGCPVCVTPAGYLDAAIGLAGRERVTVVTFGDLLRVPGSCSSLLEERARGGDIRIVYSPLDAVRIARDHPDREVVFLAVGFETTAPVIALSVKEAAHLQLGNFFLLEGLKIMPPVIRSLLAGEKVHLDGLICPGHVSAVIGETPFRFIPLEYRVPAVIAGFESLDIMMAVHTLLRLIEKRNFRLINLYKRAVKPAGNEKAMKLIDEVFMPVDGYWRGLGMLEKSSLRLRDRYKRYSAESRYDLVIAEGQPVRGCICGEILTGRKQPPECALFSKTCTPVQPAGPCMVSREGTCAAYYKYL